MRLENYIKEASFRYKKPDELSEREWRELAKLWDLINKNCKPFMKKFERIAKKNSETEGTTHHGISAMYLYRGMQGLGGKVFERMKVRKDRLPKDTPEGVHEVWDDAFNDKFGVKARSQTLFVSGKYSMASGYGDNVALIFPIGRFDVIWSDSIEDLYSEYKDQMDDVGLSGDTPDYLWGEWEREWEDIYGEGMDGWWDYNGSDMGSDLDDAISSVVNDRQSDIDEDDYEDRDDYEEALEDVWNEVDRGDFEWIPSVELDDFQQDREQEWREEASSRLDDFADAVRHYQKGSLEKAIKSGNEIHLVCDEFYAVSYAYLGWISRMLYEDEMPEFDFMKDFKFTSKKRRR